MPQSLDLLVDRRILLDVGIGLRDVRLGLVVVVVAHEVLDGVVRQQLPELVGHLSGEGLVRLDDQSRPLHPLHQPRSRSRLAGAGRAEQHDVVLARVDPPHQLFDCLWLVSARRVVADDLEGGLGALNVGNRSHEGHNTTGLRHFPPAPPHRRPPGRPPAQSGPPAGAGRSTRLVTRPLPRARSTSVLPQAVHCTLERREVPAVVDHEIGDRAPLVVVGLSSHPRPRCLLVDAPGGQPGKPSRQRGLHHDDHVMGGGQPLLHEQRHVVDDDRVRRAPPAACAGSPERFSDG